MKCFLFFEILGDSRNPLFDNAEFKSSYVQRAFQYLKFWEAARENLNQFWFIPSQVMGDHAECIETLVRYIVFQRLPIGGAMKVVKVSFIVTAWYFTI